MTALKKVGIAIVSLGLLAGAAWADQPEVLLRAAAFNFAASQRPDSTNPTIDYPTVSSGNLVNLAMGRNISVTNYPNQVLAVAFTCDLSSARLVVYDNTLSNIVGTVAESTVVYSADSYTTNGINLPPNGKTNDTARFAASMVVPASNDGTNGLVGGIVTVSGRLHRDPFTGCPLPIPVSQDKDSMDKIFAMKDVPKNKDKDPLKYTERAGLGNLMGNIQYVLDGQTNNLILPLLNLSFRYELTLAP